MTRYAIRALLALSSLTLAAAPAAAEAWRVIHISPVVPQFGRSLAYVDADGIVRNGDEVRFVYDIRYRDGDVIVGYRTPARASCTEYWYEFDGTTTFRDERRIEETSREGRRTAGERSNIRRVIEAVCNRAFQSEPVDILQHAREFTAQ